MRVMPELVPENVIESPITIRSLLTLAVIPRAGVTIRCVAVCDGTRTPCWAPGAGDNAAANWEVPGGIVAVSDQETYHVRRNSRAWFPGSIPVTVAGVLPRYWLSRYTSAPVGDETN